MDRVSSTAAWRIGVLVVLFGLAGCSSENKPAKTSLPKTPRASAGAVPTDRTVARQEPVEPPKLPAPEFQNPPSLPPATPLPELKRAPLTPPKEATPLPATAKQPSTSESKPAAGKAKRPATKKNSATAFDPIKENGPIFVGWPKPKLALVITGMEDGYLEPCGCAGLDRMKGGMTRRYTCVQQLRNNGWPLLVLDAGGLVRGFGRQAEMKFQTLVEGKRKMGYDAVAFGADDLRLPAGELVAAAAGIDGKPSMFLSSNVGLFGFDAAITPKSRVFDVGGVKVGVAAVLGKQYQKQIHNDEIEMSDPEAALKQIVPELKRSANYLVLLSHATLEESKALAKKFPDFNVVVSSNGPEVPPREPETVPGMKTLLITVGHKGMDLIVLGLFDDPAQPVRYQRVPLDSRFPSSPEMKMLMVAYQEQLKAVGFAGLGLRPVPHPLAETNGRFVGSQKCMSCHEKSYDIWKKTGHAHAYDTLVKLDPPRTADPECVSCHVIGWHPTKFFPYQSGFESKEKTPHLIDVGCEDCHGPGEKHTAAEMGSNEQLQAKLRKAMVITKEESKKQQCVSCHDLDNSPEFDFDLYWPLVEHYEKE